MWTLKDLVFKYWREYPERDVEYVRWYPVNFRRIENPEEEIFGKRGWNRFYVHIPFCKTICSYCPYDKVLWTQEKVNAFLPALKKEMEMYSRIPYVQEMRFDAVYFGGGTPTALKTEELADIIKFIWDHFDISPKVEFTVEANPETLDEEKLSTLYSLGVNRISIGIQSFNPRLLKIMGRYHTVEQGYEAINLAKKVGFPIKTIDLMCGFPSETLEEWKEDIEKAIELDLEHYSFFEVVISPGTTLYNQVLSRRLPPPLSMETRIKMHELAREMFTKAGYNHYTHSDFAKPGYECIAHSIDWEAPQGEYVGVGAGAFGVLRGWHYFNIHTIKKYVETVNSGRLPIQGGARITAKEKMARFMVLGVKFLKVDKRAFKEEFGIDIETVFGEKLRKAQEWGLIEMDDNYIRVTPKGEIYVDNLSKLFYTEECFKKPQPIAVEIATGRGISLSGMQL